MSHSKPPKQVKVGYTSYRIRRMPVSYMTAAKLDGFINFQDSEILVNKGQRLHQQAETVLHELLHAVWHQANLHDGDEQERIVGATSVGLAAVIHDNPELACWLTGALIRGD